MMQKSDVTLRRAKASDVPAIASLEKLCFSVPWSEGAISETLSRGEAVFLVAESSGEVCGYIGAYYALDEGYITNLAINPRFRRQSIGRALTERLCEEGRKLSLSFWTLEVRKSNVAAISLYEKAGFEKVGLRPRFYSSPCEDAILMTVYLSERK